MTNTSLQTLDRYVVLGNLGRGAKSYIWKVQDPTNGQVYTVKQVIKQSDDDNRYFEQAEVEYQVSSRLNHPYLRKSYHLKKIRRWLKTQELHLVMEFVEGFQLRQMVPGPTAIAETLSIFVNVAQGLASLHDAGYVHADIKPKNILIVPGDGVKIIDFGQSCPIGHRKKRIQGTPDYMAPEQEERGFLDQRTDVFNLGASLYWVVTGKKYPTTMSVKGNGGDIISPINPREVPRPDELNPQVPPSLSKLIMDCCHHAPRDRPENMREVIARLEVVSHLYNRQKPVAAPEPPEVATQPPASADKPPKRRKPGYSDDDSDDFERFIESIL